jgi:hypothetical protein
MQNLTVQKVIPNLFELWNLFDSCKKLPRQLLVVRFCNKVGGFLDCLEELPEELHLLWLNWQSQFEEMN